MANNDDLNFSEPGNDSADPQKQNEVVQEAKEIAVEAYGKIVNEIYEQEKTKTEWRPKMIKASLWLPLAVPVYLLVIFGIMAIFKIEMELFKVVVVSASLLTFVVIYSFIIKGVFSLPADTGRFEEILRKIGISSDGTDG